MVGIKCQLPSPFMKPCYQLPPFQKKGSEKIHRKGRKVERTLRAQKTNEGTRREEPQAPCRPGRITLASQSMSEAGRTAPFIMGPQASPTLCLPVGPSERPDPLDSTSTTDLSYHNITLMSLLVYVSNFLEKPYSQTSQGLDVPLTFKEGNVNFTHIFFF